MMRFLARFSLVAIAVLTILAAGTARAQLSGTQTVGPGGDFETIDAALTALNTNGVSGAVTLNVLSGTYTLDASPTLSLGTDGTDGSGANGTSATNTVTLQAQSSNAADVVIEFLSSETDGPPVLLLDGADFVTVQHLTFRPLGSGFGSTGRAVTLQGEHEGVSITNNVFEGQNPGSTSDDLTLIFGEGVSSVDPVQIADNAFSGGPGLWLIAASSSGDGPAAALEITGNIFEDTQRAVFTSQAAVDVRENEISTSENLNPGIDVRSVADAEIVSNQVTVTEGGGDAIRCFDCTGALRISKNRIALNDDGMGIRVTSDGGSGGAGLLANNTVDVFSASGQSVQGISVRTSTTRIYHNSVRIDSERSTSAALEVDDASPTVRNNILVATQGVALAVPSGSLPDTDFNDLYATGAVARQGGGSLAENLTLEDLQAEGVSANSVSINPLFADDLTTNSPFLDDVGTDLTAAVPDDIEGTARPTTPSLGAFQYTSTAGDPLMPGVFTVGSGGDYETFTAALDDLMLRGVDTGATGAVELALLSGTFAGGIELSEVPGVNADRPLVIRSDANDVSTVTVEHTASGESDNFVLNLLGADHVTLQDLTLAPLAEDFGRALRLTGAVNDLTVQRNALTLSGQAGFGAELLYADAARLEGEVSILDNEFQSPGGGSGIELQNTMGPGTLRIEGNALTDLADGLRISNNSSSSAPDPLAAPVVEENTFTAVSSTAIAVSFAPDPVVRRNTVEEGSTGIVVQASGVLRVEKNRVEGAVSVTGAFSGETGPDGLIANNTIDIDGETALSVETSDRPLGVYHNSVRGTSGLVCEVNAPDAALPFQNNICVSETDGTALQLQDNAVTSNFNDLFSASGNVARLGFTELPTLEDLQAEGFDANSLSVDPVFAGDLTTNSPFLDDTGTDLTAVVPDDIEGIARPTTPSLGAFQFTSTAGGPVMPGVFTVGPGGEYETIAAAFEDLQLRHVDTTATGAVEFALLDGTFTGGLSLPAVPGLSADRPLVIRSDANDPAAVTVEHTATDETDNYVLRLNGATHVRLEAVTWAPMGETFARAVVLSGPTRDLEFSDNVFAGVGPPSTPDNQGERRALLTSADWEPQDPLHVAGNTFQQGGFGLFFRSVDAAEGLQVVEATGNTFDGQHVAALRTRDLPGALVQNDTVTLTADDGATEGIDIQNTPGAQVIDNTIDLEGQGITGLRLQGSANGEITGNTVGVTSTGESFATAVGISISGSTGESTLVDGNTVEVSGVASRQRGLVCGCQGEARVLRNRITVEPDAAAEAAALAVTGDGSSGGGLIANNELVVRGIGGGDFFNVVLVSGSNHRLYHNSLLLHTTQGALNPALLVAGGFDLTGIELKNNVVAATREGLAFDIETPSGVTSDYNNFFTARPTLGRWGDTDVPTLADLQAQGTDANSVSVVPAFASETDLSTRSSWIDDEGTDLSGVVPEDIDGTARPATPSLGAYQIPDPVAPHAPGTFVVGPSGTYPDLSAAIRALHAGGIEPMSASASGKKLAEEVVLALEPGTYTGENHIIYEIPGASSDRRAVVTSMTGDSTDVTVEYAASAADDNFVVYLLGADYVTLRSLTVRATGASYATAMRMEGPADSLVVERSILTSVGGASASAQGGTASSAGAPKQISPAQASAIYGSRASQYFGRNIRLNSDHGTGIAYTPKGFGGFDDVHREPVIDLRYSSINAGGGDGLQVDFTRGGEPSGSVSLDQVNVRSEYEIIHGTGVQALWIEDVRGESSMGRALDWTDFGEATLGRTSFRARDGLSVSDGDTYSEENLFLRLKAVASVIQDFISFSRIGEVHSSWSASVVPSAVEEAVVDVFDVETLDFQYNFWDLGVNAQIFYTDVDAATIDQSGFDFKDGQTITVNGTEMDAEQFVTDAGDNSITDIQPALNGQPLSNPDLVTDNPMPGVLEDIRGQVRPDVDDETAGSQTLKGAYGTFAEDEDLVASVSATVSSDGPVDFGATGVDIAFSDVDGSGTVTVEKFGDPPENVEGISESNVSSFRYVITADGDLTFGTDTEVRLAVSSLQGVSDPTNVTIYTRPEVGASAFSELTTTYDADADELVAATGSFSEFALASNTEPLPVELANFEAEQLEGSVHLTWHTASERDNARFEVERRTVKQGSWQQVGSVQSKAPGGTTTQPQSYRFTDTDLPYAADSLTYRLRQVDTDGTATLIDPVTVRRGAPGEVQLRAPFPNPVRSRATVRLALPERQEVTLRVYDVLGRRVATIKDGPMEAGRTQFQLETSRLSSGVYFLRLRAEQATRTRKLTVAK